MLYISGENETLKDLMTKEEFKGSLAEYEKKFALLNPDLCAQNPNYKQKLPSHSPITLVTDVSGDPLARSEVTKELLLFPTQERQTLRMMQENEYDIPTQVAMTDMMEELQDYATGFRKWLKAPLVLTPWTEINTGLTDKSIFKLSGESLKYGSNLVQNSSAYVNREALYQNMMTRNLLNTELALLSKDKGAQNRELKKDLEKQIKELTARIKQQLPKKISDKMPRYLRKGFTVDQYRKMRANSYSEKAARNGKMLMTHLDVLNKSGLARLKGLAKGLKKLGQGINKGATLLNYGVVTYDAAQAYSASGVKAGARAFVTGASAVYLTSQAVTAAGGTAALGGYVIGALGGDLAAGSMILFCSPVLGWVIVVVAGVAAAGYVGYKMKGTFEEVWDIGEDLGQKAYQEVSKAAGLVHEYIKDGWNSGSRWILDFYGH
jgi:hypothetical protein